MKHRDAWSRQTAAAPPQPARPLSRKILNRPLNLYSRPSRPSWTFPGPHSAMCHGAPGHEPFFQRFLFDRPGGPTRQVPRYAYGGLSCLLAVASKLSSVLLGLDAIAPSPGCESPEGGRYCRLGAHRRPMPGGRLVRMDCSSACCSLRLFERTGYLFVRARGLCRPGTAYLRVAPKRAPAVVAGALKSHQKQLPKVPLAGTILAKAHRKVPL